MKKLLSLILILSLLPLCPAIAEPAADRQGKARVYTGTLLCPEELTVWHADGWEDVPFVSVREYLEMCLYLADISDYSFSSGFGGGSLTMKIGRGKAVFDAVSDTVTLSEPEEYMPWSVLVTPAWDSVIQYSEKADSLRFPGKDVTVRFQDYGLDIISSGKNLLIPFQAAEVLFGAGMTGYAFIYNGQDFYDVSYLDDSSSCAYGAPDPGPYQDAMYSGPFARSDRLTSSYSRYYVGCAAMMLDLFHGRRAETGYDSAADFIAEQGLDRLFSSRSAYDLRDGVETLLTLCFDTSHDGWTGDFGVFGCAAVTDALRGERLEETRLLAEALRGGGLLTGEEEEEEAEETHYPRPIASDDDVEQATRWVMGDDYASWVGPRGREMVRWTCLMEARRPEGTKGSSLRVVNDTAIITFDSFTDSGDSSMYYLSLPRRSDWDADTFGFFYGCFDIISRMPEVRRVVIDLSGNGGGDAPALAHVLGFLSSDGEVLLTYLNTLTGAYNEDRLHVDTNLDGVMDSRDGWGDRYDFYIVTSGSTYSCASALAYYAAKQGLAKVIGRQSGGGDCVVRLWYDAAGLISYYSGNLKLGVMEDGAFVSDEGSVPMTAEWGGGAYAVDAPWFSPEGIVEFIDRLEAEEGAGAA